MILSLYEPSTLLAAITCILGLLSILYPVENVLNDAIRSPVKEAREFGHSGGHVSKGTLRAPSEADLVRGLVFSFAFFSVVFFCVTILGIYNIYEDSTPSLLEGNKDVLNVLIFEGLTRSFASVGYVTMFFTFLTTVFYMYRASSYRASLIETLGS